MACNDEGYCRCHVLGCMRTRVRVRMRVRVREGDGTQGRGCRQRQWQHCCARATTSLSSLSLLSCCCVTVVVSLPGMQGREGKGPGVELGGSSGKWKERAIAATHHMGQYLAEGTGQGTVPTCHTCTHTTQYPDPRPVVGMPYLCSSLVSTTSLAKHATERPETFVIHL